MKNTLHIEHNPFTVETIFKWNGKDVTNQDFCAEYRFNRFQQWIEHFFDKNEADFSEKPLELTFKGIESDCLDMEVAVNAANEKGILQIDYNYEKVVGATDRLEQIKGLIEQAKQSPLFAEAINKPDIESRLDNAFNKDFDAYVVATMSSGKSTFINSLVGVSLLPALNEATTATIATIIDNDRMPEGKFKAICVNKSKETTDIQELDLTSQESAKIANDLLASWNKDKNTTEIIIEGNIIGITERENVRLVLTDTPGPNNSQDEEHRVTTMRKIADTDRYPLILYVLNGQQLGINDDEKLLQEVAKVMNKAGKQNKDRFIFIINKADVFDPEKGEYIDGVVERAKKYLINNGIENPKVYPISAQLAGLFRKKGLLADSLTRTERGLLSAAEDLFSEESSMDLVQYMPLTNYAKDLLKKRQLPIALYRSGVPAVEAMIDEYIDKYNLPMRVTRAKEALERVLTEAHNQAEMEKSLDLDKEELARLHTQLDGLKSKKNSASNSKGFVTMLQQEESAIPDEVVELLNAKESQIRVKINRFGNTFSDGEATESDANRKLDNLHSELQYIYESLIVELEDEMRKSDKITRENLMKAYEKYISSLFDSMESLQLPIFKNLKQSMSSFGQSMFNNISFRVSSGEVRNVVVGTRQESREVSDSSWYNPFSWGRTRTEYYTTNVYGDRVDLNDVWNSRSGEIVGKFNSLFKQVKNRIEENGKVLIQQSVDFMDKQLDSHLNNIINELNMKINDADARNKAIKEAEVTLSKVREFNKRLNSVLAL